MTREWGVQADDDPEAFERQFRKIVPPNTLAAPRCLLVRRLAFLLAGNNGSSGLMIWKVLTCLAKQFAYCFQRLFANRAPARWPVF